MKLKSNSLLVILFALSILCIWLTTSFILFIVFTEEVKNIAYVDLISIFKELNIFKVMSFPEFWIANNNHSFFDALNNMFEPMTALSGIASFVLLLLFSRFVISLKPALISLLLLVIGFLYIVVTWAVLLDMNETKMVGTFLSIGVQSLLVHAIICCSFSVFMLVKYVVIKKNNTEFDTTP